MFGVRVSEMICPPGWVRVARGASSARSEEYMKGASRHHGRHIGLLAGTDLRPRRLQLRPQLSNSYRW